MYTVFVTAAAQAQYEKLTIQVRTRMADVFQRLERWPAVSGVKALRGNRKTEYRIRTGDYRIVFTVDVEIRIISVVKIGHRKDVYED